MNRYIFGLCFYMTNYWQKVSVTIYMKVVLQNDYTDKKTDTPKKNEKYRYYYAYLPQKLVYNLNDWL